MRRRLVLVSGAVTTMVALAFLIPLAGLVRELARDRVLTAAERDAQTVAQILSAVPPDEVLITAIRLVSAEENIEGRRLSVVLPDGAVVGAPFEPGPFVARAQGGSAFRAAVEGGEAVFVPVVLPNASVSVVRVFVEQAALSGNVAAAWLVLGLLGLLLVTIGVAVADRLGRSMVRPVKELSKAAHDLGEGDLDARVVPDGPPELVEVGTTFNRLAERVERLLQQERETAANLSHRLRTPLTALRLDAEALSDDNPGVEELLEDIDALERTIDHVIREARRPIRQDRDAVADVAEIVEDRAEFWGALAEEQQRQWTFDVEPGGPWLVPIPPEDLEAAIDAVLGNVFAHTPDGTDFDLRLIRLPNGVIRLEVSDNGSGYADRRLLERGRSLRGSTGLGLDIVRGTATATGGEVKLASSESGGAKLVVDFGALELH